MKHLIPIFLFFLALPVLFTACKDDDNDMADKVEYTVTIDNQTSQNLDIYISKQNNSGFQNRGTALAGSELSFMNVFVSETYYMRGTLQGGDIDDFVLEDSFTNTDPNVTEFIITITE